MLEILLESKEESYYHNSEAFLEIQTLEEQIYFWLLSTPLETCEVRQCEAPIKVGQHVSP